MTIAERIRLYKQQKGLSRYELESSIPPADALKNIADALGVSSDALLNDETVAIKDKELLKKFEAIQEMSEEDKALVTRFLDLTIRDFNARKAYK